MPTYSTIPLPFAESQSVRLCLVCGAVLEKRRYESRRLFSARKTCGPQCGIKITQAACRKPLPEGRTCVVCGDPVTRNLNEPTYRFRRRITCSRSCSGINSKGASLIREKQCVQCGESFYRRHGERLEKFRYRKTCTDQCRLALMAKILTKTAIVEGRKCPVCNELLVRRPNEARTSFNDRLTCGKECGRHYQSLHSTRTSIEVAVYEALDRLGIRYKPQYKIGRYVVDALLPDSNVVVECLGDFWHANPAIYTGELTYQQRMNRERDPQRRSYIEQRGFTVIELWESEIKEYGADSLLCGLCLKEERE